MMQQRRDASGRKRKAQKYIFPPDLDYINSRPLIQTLQIRIST